MCRTTETPSEALLWAELRDRRFHGTKWRRQQKMGRFVVDFFCSEHKLVVEVDGGVHRGREDADMQRQRALECTGVRFVRFSAGEVETDLHAVLARLRAFLDFPSPLVGAHDPTQVALDVGL
jgi:very-short-patch-repair endonuclease